MEEKRFSIITQRKMHEDRLDGRMTIYAPLSKGGSYFGLLMPIEGLDPLMYSKEIVPEILEGLRDSKGEDFINLYFKSPLPARIAFPFANSMPGDVFTFLNPFESDLEAQGALRAWTMKYLDNFLSNSQLGQIKTSPSAPDELEQILSKEDLDLSSQKSQEKIYGKNKGPDFTEEYVYGVAKEMIEKREDRTPPYIRTLELLGKITPDEVYIPEVTTFLDSLTKKNRLVEVEPGKYSLGE